MNDFKRVFNETKLNAPKAEEFVKKSNQPQQQKPKQETKKQQQNQMNTSTDSTTSASSTSTSSPRKSPNRKSKSPSPTKVDYEKLNKLESMPRVNDKLAFQVLEISSNFTPEISAYKVSF